MIEIKSRFNAARVVYRSDPVTTTREAVVEAVRVGANLADADLTGADLTGANLTGANLTGANLTGANLTVELPANDPRGYRLIAIKHKGGWRFYCGCREFPTIAAARKHWGSKDYEDSSRGKRYLRALDWFARELRADKKLGQWT